MKPLHLLLFLQQHEFLAGIFCLDSNGAVRDKKRQNFWQTSSPRRRKNDILETFGFVRWGQRDWIEYLSCLDSEKNKLYYFQENIQTETNTELVPRYYFLNCANENQPSASSLKSLCQPYFPAVCP